MHDILDQEADNELIATRGSKVSKGVVCVLFYFICLRSCLDFFLLGFVPQRFFYEGVWSHHCLSAPCSVW